MIKKSLFYIDWLIKVNILGLKLPLSSSIIINDTCNLRCRHCVVSNLGYKPLTFEDVQKDILALYQTGSRMLVITGGEPMLWRDHCHNLDDVIGFARQLGFFRTVICTNGSLSLESAADYLWVSLDGNPGEHNFMRGDIYQTIIENIIESKHPRIYANFTISKNNLGSFEKGAEAIFKIHNIRGILFHLFTPYIGSD